MLVDALHAAFEDAEIAFNGVAVDRPILKVHVFALAVAGSAVAGEELASVTIANVEREARIMTDEHSGYRDVKHWFAGHGTTSHGKGEYVNLTDRSIHSNTVEGYFSIFKRGMKGIYQHCAEKHLHRYLAEFDFRYNNRVAFGIDDVQRADRALKGIVGKRLTYRTTGH